MSDADSGHDTVFSRRWVLAEDELLQLLWRCHAGENPDVVLVELHARRRAQPGPRSDRSTGHGRAERGRTRSRRAPRTTRHFHRLNDAEPGR